MTNNFFVKAWKGEEPFWLVLLIGIVGISFFVTLPFIWTHSVWPFVLFVIFIPFFLLLTSKGTKFISNQNPHSDSFWRKVVVFMVHISIFLLFVAYVVAILWVGTLSLIFHRP